MTNGQNFRTAMNECDNRMSKMWTACFATKINGSSLPLTSMPYIVFKEMLPLNLDTNTSEMRVVKKSRRLRIDMAPEVFGGLIQALEEGAKAFLNGRNKLRNCFWSKCLLIDLSILAPFIGIVLQT
jgi:hypothetical protein